MSPRSILAFYVALSAAFSWPMFAQPLAHGAGDWDQHAVYYAAVLRNAAFGALPFWNPWYCGGNVLWANPQVSLVSPVYLFALVMPLTLAMKVNVVTHYVAGCVGMHLVVRRIIGVRSLAVTAYLVSLFVFSGATALHLGAGHTNFLPVLFLPFVVYCFWYAAEGRRRYLVAGAAVIAFTIFNGGSHALPLASVLLGGLGAGASIARRSPGPLVAAAAILALGCGLAAPRIVPVIAHVHSPYFTDTRPVKQPDFMSADMLLVSFWDPAQHAITGKVTPGTQLYGWQEYGNYMGRAGATLALVSAGWILLFRRRHWREVSTALTLVVAVLLTAGEFAPWAPAWLLRKLPLVSNFRIPSRYTIVAGLTGALSIGFAARALENLSAGWRARGSSPRSVSLRWLVAALCAAGVSEIVLVNRAYLGDVFVLAADTQSRLFERTVPTVAARQLETPGGPRVHRTFMLDSMMAGLSTLDCYEPLQSRKAAQPGPMDVRGEGDVTLSDQTFSPNRIAARAVVGGEPARAILNENFAAGWTSNVGTVRSPPNRQPSVVLSSGYAGPVVFTFVPPGLWTGLAIFALACGASVLVWKARSTAAS